MLAEAIGEAFRLAALGAQRETGFDAAAFPASCPWSFDQMMDAEFWPDSE